MKRFFLSGVSLKVCLVLGVFVVLFGGPSWAEGQEPSSVKITLNNPNGAVTFDHEKHQFPCSTCHPPFDFRFDDNKGYSLRAHGTCIPCHESSKVSKECATCHQDPGFKTLPWDAAQLKSSSKDRQKVLDFFFKRRSVRKYQEKDIPQDLITDILKATMSAPTAGNWQPWIFVVVKDKKTKKALSETSPFAGYIKDAPVVIAIAGLKDNFWAPFDCGIAGSYLLLAATNLGLGVTYCGLDDEREGLGRKILDIPDTYFLYSYIPMGYPAEELKPHTKFNPGVIYNERFEKGRPYSIIDRGTGEPIH